MATPTKKKRKLAPTTEAGRLILTDIRKRLAAEEAEHGAAMVRRQQDLNLAQQQLARKMESTKDTLAFDRGVVSRVIGVLGSEGITASMDIGPIPDGSPIVAWTDFRRIHVRYRNTPDVRLRSAGLRGLMYHEGGHIRWTLPWERLIAGVKIPTLTGYEVMRYQNAWNMLEDQRMETAVVSDSPVKARYLTPVVLMEIMSDTDKAVQNWPLIVWRRYLPRRVRRGVRKLFVARYGEQLASDFEACISSYVHTTSVNTMWKAVKQYANLLDQMAAGERPQGGQPHHKVTAGSGGLTQPVKIPVAPSMEADEDEGGDEGDGAAAAQAVPGQGQAGQGSGQAADKGEGQDIGSALGQDEDEDAQGEGEGKGSGEPGTGAGSESTDITTQDLREAAREAFNEMMSDHHLDNDVDAYHSTKDSIASALDRHALTPHTDNKAAMLAEELSRDIERAFHASTIELAPTWVEQQRSGILNVGRYLTAEPWDTEVFRRYTEDEAPGHNIAVSILLDFSGSMSGHMTALATVAYASKLACERLDIPCTVVLWDTGAETVWDANERAEALPLLGSRGGTNPYPALIDLDNQRLGKDRHLVLILTDGDWDAPWRTGVYHLNQFAAPGRYIAGLGFSADIAKAEKCARSMFSYGVNDVAPITDLNALPVRLEMLLEQMV